MRLKLFCLCLVLSFFSCEKEVIPEPPVVEPEPAINETYKDSKHLKKIWATPINSDTSFSFFVDIKVSEKYIYAIYETNSIRKYDKKTGTLLFEFQSAEIGSIFLDEQFLFYKSNKGLYKYDIETNELVDKFFVGTNEYIGGEVILFQNSILITISNSYDIPQLSYSKIIELDKSDFSKPKVILQSQVEEHNKYYYHYYRNLDWAYDENQQDTIIYFQDASVRDSGVDPNNPGYNHRADLYAFNKRTNEIVWKLEGLINNKNQQFIQNAIKVVGDDLLFCSDSTIFRINRYTSAQKWKISNSELGSKSMKYYNGYIYVQKGWGGDISIIDAENGSIIKKIGNIHNSGFHVNENYLIATNFDIVIFNNRDGTLIDKLKQNKLVINNNAAISSYSYGHYDPSTKQFFIGDTHFLVAFQLVGL